MTRRYFEPQKGRAATLHKKRQRGVNKRYRQEHGIEDIPSKRIDTKMAMELESELYLKWCQGG